MAKKGIYNVLNETTGQYEEFDLAADKVAINQGIENAGKVLQVGTDGNVKLSSGGGHKIVETVPSAESAEENVVYFTDDGMGDSPEESTVGDIVNQLRADVGLQASGLAGLIDRTDVVASGERYIRYANGLQICWGVLSTGCTYISASNGSSAYKCNNNITYAVPFIAIPSICLTSRTNYQVITQYIQTSTNVGASNIMVWGPWGNSDKVVVTLDYLAIGRWK